MVAANDILHTSGQALSDADHQLLPPYHRSRHIRLLSFSSLYFPFIHIYTICSWLVFLHFYMKVFKSWPETVAGAQLADVQ
jgi:hypothetical protein